jgi:type II secretory pathway component PulC
MPPPEPKPVTSSAPPAITKPVSLKVEGIAFQDGGTDGVAVVNGVTVSKGSVIEGARIEEIQKDRVKFSRGGEKFEIILDKTN